MPRLLRILEGNKSRLLELWARRVREILRDGNVAESELRDDMPVFIEGVLEALRWAEEGGRPKTCLPDTSPVAGEHGRQRFRLGFSINAVARDYGLLRECILELAPEDVTPAEMELVSKCLSTGIEEAIAEYQRQREDALRREREQHFAFLAHELRTPLTAAKLAFDMLGKKKSLDASDRSVALVLRSLAKLRQLLDDGLVRSGLEAGLELHAERVSLQHLFAEIESESAFDLQGRGQRLVFEVDPSLSLEADPRLLRSCIGNLTQNALKFSPDGATVKVRAVQTSGRTLLTVEDECGGLPPGMADSLFAPFVQAGTDRTGFGLGLAITKQAIEAHGGTVAVRNLPAKGCIFVVDLPSTARRTAHPEKTLAQTHPQGQSSDERERTDESLSQERARTDHELEKKVVLRAHADSAVARVRKDADEALSSNRDREDKRLDHEHAPNVARDAVEEDRAQADTVTQRERRDADRTLQLERSGLQRVVSELLAQERDNTDTALESEREAQTQRGTASAHAVEQLRERLEAQSRAMEEAVQTRDSFLSMAAHELRTPLTSLQLQVQRLVRDEPAPGDQVPESFRRGLAKAEHHVRGLGALVHRLLEVPALLRGTLDLERGPVDLSALAREVADGMRASASRAGSKITLDLQPDVQGNWDRARLAQALTCLLTNAITYGMGKPIALRLRTDGGMARLSLEDHGLGIDPKDHERVFRRFERAVSESSYGGFGLGLWVVKQIVNALGGEVSVSSQLGAGATFFVVLPLETAAAP